MKKISCRVGCLIILFVFLAWLTSSNGSVYAVTAGEVISAFIIGLALIMPELVYQINQFLTSGAKVSEIEIKVAKVTEVDPNAVFHRQAESNYFNIVNGPISEHEGSSVSSA